jgi:hypothetical protein
MNRWEQNNTLRSIGVYVPLIIVLQAFSPITSESQRPHTSAHSWTGRRLHVQTTPLDATMRTEKSMAMSRCMQSLRAPVTDRFKEKPVKYSPKSSIQKKVAVWNKSPNVLRGGAGEVEKWGNCNPWMPRIAKIETAVEDKSLAVTLEPSGISYNRLVFKPAVEQTVQAILRNEAAPVKLAKFDHVKGSMVYEELFTPFLGDDGHAYHFYQKLSVPYEAVLIPYPQPWAEPTGLGKKGYIWPQKGDSFHGVCREHYPKGSSALQGLIEPFDEGYLPNISVQRARKAPTPVLQSFD